MKKILFFYLLCCISIILLWLAIDDCDIESKDFKFGFNALFFITCIFYGPIFTIPACILYYTKICKAILSNIRYSILYCIFPFLCYKILTVIFAHIGTNIGSVLEYSIPVVFIIQNVIIVLKVLIKK